MMRQIHEMVIPCQNSAYRGRGERNHPVRGECPRRLSRHGILVDLSPLSSLHSGKENIKDVIR